MQKTHFFETHFHCEYIKDLATVNLNAEESHHLCKVLRLTAGTQIKLCDGQGTIATAEITVSHPQNSAVKILASQSFPHPPGLHLAVACLKDHDLEDVLEHCAQMPVASFTLLRTQHSLEPRKSDLGKLVRRLEHKALVALKQSLSPWRCEVSGPIYLQEWLQTPRSAMIVCEPSGSSTLPDAVLQAVQSSELPRAQQPVILVGPEGGFSPAELQQFQEQGAYFYQMGSTRLRARTATIVALSSVLALSYTLNERR